jgi:hypothetical protein
MARVTITDAQGVVETPGTGLVVSSATTYTGATTCTGAIVGNAAIGSNDIVGVLQCAVGSEVTVLTDNVATVSGAVSVPANAIIVGIALRCTATVTIGSAANWTLNVGTAADGSGSTIVAAAGGSIASSASTFLKAAEVVGTSGYGSAPEAGSLLALRVPGGDYSGNDGAILYSATARSVYFKTTSSSGNPTAGRYIPMVYFVRIA